MKLSSNGNSRHTCHHLLFIRNAYIINLGISKNQNFIKNKKLRASEQLPALFSTGATCWTICLPMLTSRTKEVLKKKLQNINKLSNQFKKKTKHN